MNREGLMGGGLENGGVKWRKGGAGKSGNACISQAKCERDRERGKLRGKRFIFRKKGDSFLESALVLGFWK